MIATRTLPSSRRALPLVVATGPSGKLLQPQRVLTRRGPQLLADMQDALDDREPGRRGERDDRPREAAPRREDETRGDEDDALCPGAQADVALQAESFGAGAGVRDEERADDGRDGDHDSPIVVVTGEHARDRGA